MKKTFIFALAVLTMAFVGCAPGNKQAANEAETIGDTTHICGDANPDSLNATEGTAVTDSASAAKAEVAEAEATKVAAPEENVTMPTCKQVMKIIDDTWNHKLSDSHPVLSELGMKCLKYNVTHDEVFTCVDAFYGKNATVKQVKNGDYPEFKVVPTGPHAVVVYLGYESDNYQCVYFSDESDYRAFLKTIKPGDNWEPGQKKDGMFVAQELH